MKTRMKKAAWGVGIVLVVLLALKFVGDLRYFHGYDPSAPLNPVVKSVTPHEGFETVYFTFEGVDHDAVPTLLTLPLERKGPVPCVIFLHGIGQKKDFLEKITLPFNQNGFAMACFDQYMQGERKINGGALAKASAFIQRPRKTILETRRLVDYLTKHPDIDPERIYLVGASYGAITGATAAAMEPRIKAVVLVYGGGNLSYLLDAPAIKQEAGPMLALLKPIVNFFLWPADPVRYAGQISPRPVFLQNGTRDRLIATQAAEALQEACREPKKIVWYEGDHIGLDRDTVLRVLDDGLQWLREQDAKVVQALQGTSGGLANAA
jgi:dienelactone hydrolase